MSGVWVEERSGMKYRRAVAIAVLSLVFGFSIDLIVAAVGTSESAKGSNTTPFVINHTYREARGWPRRSVVFFRGIDGGNVVHVAHDWFNTLINLTVYAPTFALLTFALWPICQRIIRKAGHCPACGYDLNGNESGVCPECGAERSEP